MSYVFGNEIEQYLIGHWWNDVSSFLHLQHSFEMVLVQSGTMHITIQDGRSLYVHAGEAAFFAPYTLHGFENDCANTSCILEFPSDFTQEFYEHLKSHCTQHPIVRLSDVLWAYLCNVLPTTREKFILQKLHAQAILLPLCNAFVSGCNFYETETKYQDNFIHAMMLVSQHFQEPITLGGVAQQIGIRREALTRLFRRHTGCTLWNYVLILRTMYAITLLRKGKRPTEAAFEAGFNSIRTFNRVFLAKIGMSPTEFLQHMPAGDAYLFMPEIEP